MKLNTKITYLKKTDNITNPFWKHDLHFTFILIYTVFYK